MRGEVHRSYLSVVASRDYDVDLWRAWDVDHANGNQLIEARPLWGADGQLDGLHCYPQVTCARRGPAVYAAPDEIRAFGAQHYTGVLYRAAHNAYLAWRGGDKRRLTFDRLKPGMVMAGYRYSPRVYTPRSIGEIYANVAKQSFILRYQTDQDKQMALDHLSGLDTVGKPDRFGMKPGSHEPAIACYFDIGTAVRAMLKTGMNLLATYCTRTQVDAEHFPRTAGLVLGSVDIQPADLRINGFVDARGVGGIAHAGHSFRIVYDGRAWHVYSAYFGGAAGSRVVIPGPSQETWRTLDVVAPIGNKTWSVDRLRTAVLLDTVVVPTDLDRIIPSLRWKRSSAEMIVERVPRRTPPAAH